VQHLEVSWLQQEDSQGLLSRGALKQGQQQVQCAHRLAIITSGCQKTQHNLQVISREASYQELPSQAQEGSLHCVEVVGRKGALPLWAVVGAQSIKDELDPILLP
jgi:hypothetical protein